MEVVIVSEPATGGRLVADVVAGLVGRRPDCVLGLATGSSPQPVYRELAARRGRDGVAFDRVRAFQLDEYVGLSFEHPQSYRSVIAREVCGPLGLSVGAVHGPDGLAEDLDAACTRFEEAIEAAGGIDLQLLGVGTDGHIGFNEPTSSLASRTRVKTLTAQTRRDNSRFFDGDPDRVPRLVLTQGIATILDARHLVLLAWGAGKAAAVARLVEGPVSAMVPASALQLHRHVTVVVDEPAAAQLQLADYYRETWASRPTNQTVPDVRRATDC